MFTRRAVIGGLATLGHPWIGLARSRAADRRNRNSHRTVCRGLASRRRCTQIGAGDSERLQRKVIVENRAGAGGVTGLAAVATSRADGRTIGFATVGPLAMAPPCCRTYRSIRRAILPISA